MKIFLVKNRYYLFALERILNKNYFGFFLLTSSILEFRQYLLLNNIFNLNFQLSNTFLRLLFSLNSFKLFKGIIYFLFFFTLENCLNFYQLLKMKVNFYYEFFLVKLNNFFISKKIFLLFIKVFSKNKNFQEILINFYFYYIFLIIRYFFIIFQYIFYIFFNLKRIQR